MDWIKFLVLITLQLLVMVKGNAERRKELSKLRRDGKKVRNSTFSNLWLCMLTTILLAKPAHTYVYAYTDLFTTILISG